MTAVRSEEIYEALFDEEAFSNLPQLLARAGNGRSALLHWRHSTGDYETLAYSYFTPELMADYAQTFRELDPWVDVVFSARQRNPAIARQRNMVINMDRALPSPIFERSAAYNECIRSHGDDTMHCLAVAMETGWGEGILGVHRGRGAPEFEDADVAELQRSVDVLRKVLVVRGEIIARRRNQSLAQASLDSFAQAAIVVARNGRILNTNAASEAVLCRSDGLKSRDGVLSCATHADTCALAALLAAATRPAAPEAGAMVVNRGPGSAPYLVTVSVLIGRVAAPAALLVFRDPDAIDASLKGRLRSFFGLTASEADVAVELGRAASTDRIISARGVSRHTLRSQLRSIAEKMNCRRQSEIAATIAALPAIASAEAGGPRRSGES